MEKPISLQEFANQRKEHYQLIKEVVEHCRKIIHYKHGNICAICDKELTNEEKEAIQPSHFNYCCKEHIKYANCFILDKIREELGYPKDQLFIGGIE